MGLLSRQRAALVVVDVQEGFRSYASFEDVARACATLVEGSRILEVPRIVSEQYPKGLGHSVCGARPRGRAGDREDRVLRGAGRGVRA